MKETIMIKKFKETHPGLLVISGIMAFVAIFQIFGGVFSSNDAAEQLRGYGVIWLIFASALIIVFFYSKYDSDNYETVEVEGEVKERYEGL